MAGALIIGYGNPLRGDDGVGWHAAQRLAALFRESETEVMTCRQLTPELAEPVSRANVVVFIDAEQGEPAGRLSCQPIIPDASLPCTFSHHLTPLNLLGLAQRLYGTCPQAIVFSMCSRSFGYGEELSAPVAAALPELIGRIRTLVSRRKRTPANR
jgi:hydrogenase maturation protease